MQCCLSTKKKKKNTIVENLSRVLKKFLRFYTSSFICFRKMSLLERIICIQNLGYCLKRLKKNHNLERIKKEIVLHPRTISINKMAYNTKNAQHSNEVLNYYLTMNINNICRICLERGPKLMPIFDPVKPRHFSILIMECASVQVSFIHVFSRIA